MLFPFISMWVNFHWPTNALGVSAINANGAISERANINFFSIFGSSFYVSTGRLGILIKPPCNLSHSQRSANEAKWNLRFKPMDAQAAGYCLFKEVPSRYIKVLWTIQKKPCNVSHFSLRMHHHRLLRWRRSSLTISSLCILCIYG